MPPVVHHLACGQLHPKLGRLVYERGGHRHLVCHCLLVEMGDELVLVDTGLGRADMADPRGRLGRGFLAMARPVLDERHTAIAQLEQRGFDPRAVRHIVVTHLDLDHIGGLADFPEATVHVMRTEHAQAHGQAAFHDRQRYHPVQWSHGVRWALHDVAGETWQGLEAVHALPGLPPEILLVPTLGHSAGHAAVAVQSKDGWLLHCGDAYFHRGEVDLNARGCPPGLRLFQWLVAHDREARLHNQARLRELARAGEGMGMRLFCAHDPQELARLQGDA